MNKNELLKSELDHFAGILYAGYTCLRYTNQMAATNFDGDTNLLDQSEHLRFFAKVLNRTFYLEIAKIVIDGNDGRNLHKTLRKLKPGGTFASIKFPINIILELQAVLETQKEIIRKIQDVRNREIAHSEFSVFQISKPIDIHKLTLSFEECLSIFNSVAKILNTIAKLQFDTDYHMQFTMFMYRRRSFHNLLTDIHAAQKIKKNKILNAQPL
jgi:hypothetical protein